MKIAICDDEQVMMEHICELVKQYRPDYMVELYGCGEALLEDAQLYDLIFLDIEMPSINGMEVAENLRKMQYSGEIIFLTGYMEYIQEAFKVRAFRYLQKPIVERQLEEALCSAEEQIRKRYLYLDTGHKKSVKLQDIIYIEAIHNRSYIMTKKEEIEIRIPMKNLCARLPKEDFVQTHKSYIVALQAIWKIEGNEIVLQDICPRIPLSRGKMKEVKQAYLTYVRRHSICV